MSAVNSKTKRTVALLSGGISSEREVSLKGGDQVFESLSKEKYNVIRYDPKTDINRLISDAPQIDVALIIMHGTYGEDGTIQGLLDLLNIPYQGAGVLGSALAMNKLVSKRLYHQAGLNIPPYIPVKRDNNINLKEIIQRLGMPLVVKPVSSGSSVGMTIVKSEDMLKTALDKAFVHDEMVLMETYIKGIELTGGVIGNDKPEALPIIEIIPDKSHEFFDYHAKYTPGASQEICPARINEILTKKAQRCAVTAHEALFCKGYSRTDMILKDEELFILETNTIPGMTPTSLLPLAAKTAGIPFSNLLDRLIDLSIEDAKTQKSKGNAKEYSL